MKMGKTLLLIAAAAFLCLGAFGCNTTDDGGDHPKGDHPAKDHPEGEGGGDGEAEGN